MKLRTLGGDEPHPDYGGWQGFLDTAEVRDEILCKEGKIVFYGKTNCNYIVFPNGVIVENFGFHGRCLMNRIREEGWEVVFNDLKQCRDRIDEILHSH